jgi:hypothetical protein
MPMPGRDSGRGYVLMEPQRAGRSEWPIRRIILLAGTAVGIVLVALAAVQFARTGRLPGLAGRTAISQDLVVEKVREVARIVSSEVTIRDIVTFEQTSYGSTKRALLVARGKVLAGIDLERGSEVRIDHDRRRISIRIPEASILAVDIVSLQTYDEQRGLWNPFEPADRDAIYQRVRRQLFSSAEEMGILRRANESAARTLETMFSVSGYTTEVRIGLGAVEIRRDSGESNGGDD